MVASFLAFSSFLSAVALAMLSSSSLISWASSVTCSFSLEIEAASSSDLADSCSTSAVFSSRVTLLSWSSVLHQAWWSASAAASSCNRSTRSLIICFTLAIGSSLVPSLVPAATSAAARARVRLLSLVAVPCNNSYTLCTPSGAFRERWADANWTKEVAFWLRTVPKCLSDAPSTSLEDRISTALSIASISPARVACRPSNSWLRWLHCASMSLRYLVSSAWARVTASRSPWLLAADCLASPRAATF
mmetsp:Transcript_39286/g.85672  ORF Transcript_39286/g.85672 Transcript_39286/m.85672 type:complete len:247 (-) Transcript_39286:866-1606(-)